MEDALLPPEQKVARSNRAGRTKNQSLWRRCSKSALFGGVSVEPTECFPHVQLGGGITLAHSVATSETKPRV